MELEIQVYLHPGMQGQPPESEAQYQQKPGGRHPAPKL